MNNDIINTLILGSSFLVLFGIAELLYHQLKIKVEYTRKLVHFVTGLITLLFPVMLGNHWLVLFLIVSFALILVFSLKYNQLKSINAIERESVGSIAYPISVYGCYLAYDFFSGNYIYFYMPILVLAISDPLAALAGKKWPLGKYKSGKDDKTLMGSGMFFISAFLVSIIVNLFLNRDIDIFFLFSESFFIASLSTCSEALSRKGYDNITIPASVLLGLIIMLQFLY